MSSEKMQNQRQWEPLKSTKLTCKPTFSGKKAQLMKWIIVNGEIVQGNKRIKPSVNLNRWENTLKTKLRPNHLVNN